MNSYTLLKLNATQDPTSIKCCCNKYATSYINNHFNHIITGNLNIVNNQTLRKLISKGPKYQEPKQICLEEAHKEIQTSTDQFIEKILNDKGIHKNHFSEWKSHVMSLVNEKISTFKNKLTCRSVNLFSVNMELKTLSFLLKRTL